MCVTSLPQLMKIPEAVKGKMGQFGVNVADFEPLYVVPKDKKKVVPTES